MRKLLLCAMAVLALMTAGCKKDKDPQPQEENFSYTLKSTVQKLEGHDHIDGEPYRDDFNILCDNCQSIIDDDAIKEKEEKCLP